MSGNKVTWNAECVEGGATSEAQGEITYSGDSYKGNLTIKTRDASGRVTVSTGVLSGRRIGDCTDKNKQTVTVGGQEVAQTAPPAIAEMQKSQAENKARSAEFTRLAVPGEDPGACVLADKGFGDSAECARKVGKLNMNPGEWEITVVQATKTGGAGANTTAEYMVGNPEKRTECLTFDSMVPSIAKDGANMSEKKRTSGKITWKYTQSAYGTTMDERGGIIYKGNSLEGVVVKTQTVQQGSVIEYKTRITGSRKGDGNCLQKRDYTSQKRTETSPTKDVGTETVNKLKGLFGK